MGFACPHRRPQVGSESGTSGTNGIPLILFIFFCSTNRHEAAHFRLGQQQRANNL